MAWAKLIISSIVFDKFDTCSFNVLKKKVDAQAFLVAYPQRLLHMAMFIPFERTWCKSCQTLAFCILKH